MTWIKGPPPKTSTNWFLIITPVDAVPSIGRWINNGAEFEFFNETSDFDTIRVTSFEPGTHHIEIPELAI
jgi:hypothetical protein